MELHWLSAVQLAQGYRRREFSPVEVVQSLLQRISQINGTVHAFLSVDDQEALRQARQAEKELLSGSSASPLLGIPYGVKDLIDIQGQPTTCHSRLMENHCAQSTAQVIRLLDAAGAIRIGKLALHEFAIGGPAFDLPFPPARNPWDLQRHPGGSSSGSGAAVAAGMVPLAIGTDTGGSVRHPAGACGVYGLKPTYEAVSRQGVFPLAFTLDHVGPLARSVRDIGAMFDVLSGSTEAGLHGGLNVEVPIRGLRVGYVRHFHEKDMTADPDVVSALDETAKQLGELGAIVSEVTLPTLETFDDPQKIILWSEGWAIHSQWLQTQPEQYCATSRRKLLPGAFLSAGDYVHALQKRQTLIRAVDDVLGQVDVLLVANSMDPPCLIEDTQEVARTYMRQARSPFNLTGHPALAMPNGMSRKGQPLSAQIVGRWHDEVTLLRVAAAYEQSTQWHLQHPQIDL